jgi:hypothetical protein
MRIVMIASPIAACVPWAWINGRRRRQSDNENNERNQTHRCGSEKTLCVQIKVPYFNLE